MSNDFVKDHTEKSPVYVTISNNSNNTSSHVSSFFVSFYAEGGVLKEHSSSVSDASSGSLFLPIPQSGDLASLLWVSPWLRPCPWQLASSLSLPLEIMPLSCLLASSDSSLDVLQPLLLQPLSKKQIKNDKLSFIIFLPWARFK